MTRDLLRFHATSSAVSSRIVLTIRELLASEVFLGGDQTCSETFPESHTRFLDFTGFKILPCT